MERRDDASESGRPPRRRSSHAIDRFRVSEARNELIGAEDESHAQLATHAVRLRERHAAPADGGR